MAYNNAWANYRLLKACGCLTQADFVAARTSFFPSIKATLNHILTVDWYYIDALERSVKGNPPNHEFWHFFASEEPFDNCSDLQHEQRVVDKRLIALCKASTDPMIDKPVSIPRRDGIHVEQRARILAHLFQHQIHHRGQVHAMLAGTSVKPPQLDEFFCAGDVELRADDFRELGFSEEEIWGISSTVTH